MFPIIYIMSPYTHADEDVMNYKAHLAACGVAELMSLEQYRNFTIFSPIVHYHQVALRMSEKPRTVDYWWHHNLSYMLQARMGIVLTIPGWKESAGIKREIDWFRDNKKPLEFYSTAWEAF